MNQDRSSDPADARLAALYRAHLADTEQPSAASDARILALAREAGARPAAKPVASGWRSWLQSRWFGPGLAFATIASLSVVVVSLMPKEEISAERAITSAPGAPTPPTSPTAPVTTATPSPQAAAPSAESRTASTTASASGVQRAPDEQSQPKQVQTHESVRPLPQRSAPKVERPNPFPAQSPPAAMGRADHAAAASAPGSAGVANGDQTQHLEKPSLLSEPTESQMSASPPIPEVRDSAPTYANEPQPAIAPPRPYARPRAPARDAASGFAAPTGSLAGKAAAQKEIMAERHAADKSAPSAAAAQAMAPAPLPRDPAEWIKAIQKLRAEGKSEQVTKELTEFRRQYPLYPLPDELKQIR